MFTVIMVIASLRTTVLLCGLFTILAVTFFLLAFGDLAGNATLAKTGGYFGIATALWAWLLCLGRRGRGHLRQADHPEPVAGEVISPAISISKHHRRPRPPVVFSRSGPDRRMLDND